MVLVSLGHIILLGQQHKRRLQPDLHANKGFQRLAVGACPEPLDAAIITTPERQLISDCRPVTQLGLLVRSHALLELMQMTAASFVRVECLLQCLQNQARLARLQAGNGAARKRRILRTGLTTRCTLSRAARSRALSSPNLREVSRAAPRDSRLQGIVIAGAMLRERETLDTPAPVYADRYHSVVAAFVRRAS